VTEIELFPISSRKTTSAVFEGAGGRAGWGMSIYCSTVMYKKESSKRDHSRVHVKRRERRANRPYRRAGDKAQLILKGKLGVGQAGHENLAVMDKVLCLGGFPLLSPQNPYHAWCHLLREH
jgi:hypothetical protein